MSPPGRSMKLASACGWASFTPSAQALKNWLLESCIADMYKVEVENEAGKRTTLPL
jgi:hypothetical protein